MKINLELKQPYDKYNQGDSVCATIESGIVTLEDVPMNCRFDLDELKRLVKLIEVSQELE